ncbi:MAG: type II toxin-antitoxin system CcdA family antitoxin [Methylophilaceae bacterium]
MTAVQTSPLRKRPVNLTLNEQLVSQAKGMTDNLSAVVESLLTDYVAQHQEQRLTKMRQAELTAQAWNTFNEHSGTFADEHSTL